MLNKSKEIRYTLQYSCEGGWHAISSSNKNISAIKKLKELREQKYPAFEFRIIKITTIKEVVNA